MVAAPLPEVAQPVAAPEEAAAPAAERAVASEAFARQICARYGISPLFFDQPTHRRATHGLRVLNPTDPDQPVSSLLIPEWGRFGNAMVQLTNAVDFCKRHGIARLYAAQPLDAIAYGDIGEIAFAPAPEGGLDGPNVLAMRCFYADMIGVASSPDGWRAILRDEVAPLVRARLPGIKLLGADTLVVSIRSGDIFGTRPHPSYGQPPLAFYVAVVEREAPRQVVIVCENLGNPVISALAHEMGRRRIRCRIQSGSFAEDLTVILSARRLVISRGSFGWIASQLAARLERVYHFNHARFRHYAPEPGVIGYTDVDRRYSRAILRQNWVNSFPQRQLMLGYPLAKIAPIEEVRAAAEAAAEAPATA